MPTEERNVIFHRNDGSQGSTEHTSLTTSTFPTIDSLNWSRIDKKFAGWYTESLIGDGITPYAPGDSLIENENEYYAIWKNYTIVDGGQSVVNYVQDLILDLNANNAYTTVSAKQFDNARYLRIFLTKNNIAYNVDPSHNFYFRMRKPDGHAIINPAMVQFDSIGPDNIVTDENSSCIYVQLTEQCLATAGRGYADIVEYDATGAIVSSIPFILNIMSAPNVGNDLTSSSEFEQLTELVARSQEVIEDAEAWGAGTRHNEPIGPGDDAYHNNAKYYSEQAAWHINTITELEVDGNELAPGTPPSVEKINPDPSDPSGHYKLVFGIPIGATGSQGERGPKTVWVNNDPPSGADALNYDVWVNPSGAKINTLFTAEEVYYDTNVAYSSDRIGYAVKSLENVKADAEAAASSANKAVASANAAVENANEAVANANEMLNTIDGKIAGKVDNPALPTDTGNNSYILTVKSAIQDEATVTTYSWVQALNYNTNLQTNSLPAINSHILTGNQNAEDLGLVPLNPDDITSPSDFKYLYKTEEGIPSNWFSNETNTALNKANSAIQAIKINGNIHSLETESSTTVDLGNYISEHMEIPKNYLDNSWFMINQRGRTTFNKGEYEVGTYFCDRWKLILDQGTQINQKRLVTLANGALNISTRETSTIDQSFEIGQIIDKDVWASLSGQKVSLSAQYKLGAEEYQYFTFNGSCPLSSSEDVRDGLRKQMTYIDPPLDSEGKPLQSGWGLALEVTNVGTDDNPTYELIFKIIWRPNGWVSPGVLDDNISISKVKLEVCSFGTLDVTSRPEYNQELARCQKYLVYYGGKAYNENAKAIILGQGTTPSATLIDWFIPLQQPLAGPCKFESSVDLKPRRGFSISAGTGNSATITSAAVESAVIWEGAGGVYLSTTAASCAQSAAYYVTLPATTSDGAVAYFAISAEP